MLKIYKVDSVKDLPVNMAGIRLDLGEQQDTRNAESQFNLVKQQLAGQKKIFNTGGLLSPFLSARMGSMGLAQTDPSSHWQFSDSAERYRRAFVNRMNRAISYESGKQEAFTEYKASSALWKDVAKFEYGVVRDDNKEGQSHFMALSLWFLISAVLLILFSKKLNPLA